ncbi:MAG: CHASE3 domain-containing protein, partial [Tepidisphaeraceae bacterium]
MQPLTTERGMRSVGFRRTGRLARMGSLPFLFGVILLLIGASRVANTWDRRIFLESQLEVTRWQNDLGQLQDLMTQLTAAESAQRGFLLTDEREYLLPYSESVSRLGGILENVRNLAATGRVPAQDASRLTDLTSQKLAEMDETISLEETKGPQAAQALVRSDQGAGAMRQIRDVIDGLTARDEANLAVAANTMKQAEAWRTDLFVWGGLVNIPVIVWAMWRIWGETGRRADLMEELFGQKELLAVTLGSIGDGVIVTDIEGRVTFFNSAAEQLTGWSSAEAQGRPCSAVFKLISEETRQPIASPVEKALSENSAAGLTNPAILKRRDGAEIPIDDCGAPVRDSDGVMRGVVLVFRDFTKHKRAEQNLIRAAAELESSGKAKDQFLAALSHELRTPLTPLLVMLSMWEQDEKIPPNLRDDVRIMRRNVQLEARLIDDLLDLTRVAKGKLLLNLEVIDLNVLINSVIATFELQMTAKSLNVTRSLLALRHFVRADPTRIEQVFWNVMQNAIKFTPSGGTISICTRNDGEGWIEASIADDGMGMEPGMMPRLFRPFEQASDDMVRRHGGLGMGLAIA